ncbi:MAG: hypothetical protein ACSHXD_01705 [Marinosulfonomonas sp.]
MTVSVDRMFRRLASFWSKSDMTYPFPGDAAMIPIFGISNAVLPEKAGPKKWRPSDVRAPFQMSEIAVI